MKRLAFLLLIPILAITSCRYSEKDKTFVYQDEWRIEYPSYMRKASKVYPGTELQLGNGYRDTYAFVREVVTAKRGEILVDSLSRQLTRYLEDVRVQSDSAYQVEGNLYHTQKIVGRLNDKTMYYLLSVIEAEFGTYQITGWMFNDKRPLWEDDYDRMLHSWRSLKN